MVLTMVLTFAVTTTAEVNAAPKTKTQYVWTEIKSVNTYTDSYTGKTTDTNKTNYYYNKNGLLTSVKYDSGKWNYTRNKKGFITQAKSYNKKGKLESKIVYKLDGKGRVKNSTTYNAKGKKTEYETNTYYSNGMTKKTSYKTDDHETIINFDKKGNVTKEVSKSTSKEYSYTNTTTYKNTKNKKGDVTKSIATSVWTDEYGTRKEIKTTNYKYKYDKKGRITKITGSSVTTSDGKEIRKETSSTANTYNKRGAITKSVETSNTTDLGEYGGTTTSKSTTTYKYKKVKIPKKFWSVALPVSERK